MPPPQDSTAEHSTYEGEALVPVCCVDNVAPSVLDKLLDSRDNYFAKGPDESEWANKEPDVEGFLFVARSIESNDDALEPTLPPTSAFASPFVNMSFGEIHRAILRKRETRKRISVNCFVVVDARTAEDGTVWICEAHWSRRGRKRIKKLRSSFAAVEEVLANLTISHTPMDDYIDAAEKTGGVLQPL